MDGRASGRSGVREGNNLDIFDINFHESSEKSLKHKIFKVIKLLYVPCDSVVCKPNACSVDKDMQSAFA